jgi:hypothetical protein
MDNSQNNGASAPPAEEQVQRVEEAAVGGNPVEGNPSAGNMAPQAQAQTAQNTAQGEAATPLETGVRKRSREAAGGRGEGGSRGGAGQTQQGKAAEVSQGRPGAQ